MSERKDYLQRYPDGSINFRYQRRTLGRLPLPEGSKEFNAEYDSLLKSVGGKPKPRGRPAAMLKPKQPASVTIGSFVTRYKASDFFADPDKPNLIEKPLAPGSQYHYRLALDLLDRQGVTALSFADLTPHKAHLYIQKIRREFSGSAARMQMTVLSNLWTFARNYPDFNGGDRTNPMKGREVTNPYTLKREHQPWPEEVQDDFLAACDENLYVAFHLLICTGQRISDVARMTRDQYNGTHITLTQQKDRTQTPMKIKAPKLLRDVLAKAKKSNSCDNLLTHKWGQPYKVKSLSMAISTVLRDVGHDGYSAHGLRKNAGIMLAENGATVPQIMAALGHKTPKMALYYCRLADQSRLADQAADILDLAFGAREGRRQARVAKRRSTLKLVP
jgi:integrase